MVIFQSYVNVYQRVIHLNPQHIRKHRDGKSGIFALLAQ